MRTKKQTGSNQLVKNSDSRNNSLFWKWPTNTLVFFLLSVCFFSGCLTAGKSLRSKDNFMKTVYLNEIKPELEKGVGIQDIQISFEKALELSIQENENLSLIRFSWKKDKIDLKQARSLIFPRVKLQIFNETYYSNSEKKIKDNIDGGLMFQYNFLNLLFQGGHISIKKAALQSSIIKGRIEIQNLFLRFLLILMERDYNIKEIELSENFLKYATGGLALSERLAKEGRIKPGETWTWSHYVYDARERYEEAKNRLEFLQRSIKFMLGKTNSGKIEVLNVKRFIPEIDRFHKQEIKIPGVILEAWQQRNEVKLAEVTLFMSEMKLVKSKLGWLNYFRISLGFGRFFIYRDDDRANVTLNTSITLPIFDMGDAKRIKKKAEIDRDISRTRVKNLARIISREVREAVEKVKTLKSSTLNSEKMVQRMKQQKEIVKRLIKLNQAEVLDLYLARIACLNARQKYHHTCFELKKAIVQLKKVRGALVNPELEEKLIKKMLEKK